MTSPAPMPTTSDSRFPNPAAAKVDMPRVTPIDLSMASPAKIMITLSANPNPTKGTPFANAKRQSCARLGGSTLALVFCCLAAAAGGAVDKVLRAVRAARRHIFRSASAARRERCTQQCALLPVPIACGAPSCSAFELFGNARVIASLQVLRSLAWAGERGFDMEQSKN